MTAGLLVAEVRATIVALLAARPTLSEVVVGYAAPLNHISLQVDTAERPSAIWLGGEAEGTLEPSYGMKGMPYATKEAWTQVVMIQVLPRNKDDDQASMETLLADLVGEVVAELAADYTAGITMPSGGLVQIVPASFSWVAGPLGDRGSGARCELSLSVEADRC